MRALDALLVLVLLTAWVVGFFLILRNLRRRRPRWRVGGHRRQGRAMLVPLARAGARAAPVREDGALLAQLERAGERALPFRELPPAMDSVDFASDLRLAVEQAEAQAA